MELSKNLTKLLNKTPRVEDLDLNRLGSSVSLIYHEENMKQTRPFQVTLTKKFKSALKDDAKRFKVEYGIFFDTSGKAMVERINPTAQYNYIFRTDRD